MSRNRSLALVAGLVALLLVLLAIGVVGEPRKHTHEQSDALVDVPQVPASLGIEQDDAKSSRRADESPSRRMVRVIVRDPLDHAVPRARVFAIVGSLITVLGDATMEGTLSVPATAIQESVKGGHLLVRAAGFQPCLYQISAPPPADMIVCMQTGCLISGQVVDQMGMPVGDGMFVVARRHSANLVGKGLVAAIRAGASSDDVVTTDSEGRFAFQGMREDADYFLFAAGNGYVPLLSNSRVRSSSKDAQLVVTRLYAVEIILQDHEGRPLSCSNNYLTFPGEHVRVSSNLVTTFGDLPLCQLAAPHLSVEKQGSSRRLFFFTSTENQDAITGIRIRLDPPSYGPQEFEATAAPVLAGILPSIVQFESVSDERGDLVLRFVGEDDAVRCAGALRGFHVTLTSRGGLVLRYTLPLGPGPRMIQGIPSDRYRLSISHSATGFSWPTREEAPISVEIGPTPAYVEIPLAGTGGIDIEVSASDALPYVGPLVVLVARGSASNGEVFAGTGDSVILDSAPFRLVGMVPGTYCLRLMDPKNGLADNGLPFAIVEVPAAGKVEARFLLP